MLHRRILPEIPWLTYRVYRSFRRLRCSEHDHMTQRREIIGPPGVPWQGKYVAQPPLLYSIEPSHPVQDRDANVRCFPKAMNTMLLKMVMMPTAPKEPGSKN